MRRAGTREVPAFDRQDQRGQIMGWRVQPEQRVLRGQPVPALPRVPLGLRVQPVRARRQGLPEQQARPARSSCFRW